MAKRTNRVAWGMAALLGEILLLTWLRPYWTAKHQGQGANLRRAVLVRAPLRRSNLDKASLVDACLVSADLRCANLRYADLKNANLCGADLRYADLSHADLRGANLDRAVVWEMNRCGFILLWTTPRLTGARYDSHTRWPDLFDPARHGAIKVE